MSDLVLTAPIPLPALPTLTTRVATMDDLAFVDGLQKKHNRQLGFFPRAQIEGYLRNGWMRVAEDGGERVGYIAYRDRYQKRDELGAVFQLCVEPGRQRGLIGATLLRDAFEASAYGCRLFCCWCAQDLAANHFWEAMGFSAIAFRTGSDRKSRVHIFWQKRIRSGDAATPWWFPASTDGGAMREGRIVLPIGPGTHWSAVRVIEMPGVEKALPAPRAKRVKKAIAPQRPAGVMPGGMWFAPVQAAVPAAVEKPKREKAKPDPRLIAASRELRDRWLEQVNASPGGRVGKYEVTRAIADDAIVDGEVVATKLLAA